MSVPVIELTDSPATDSDADAVVLAARRTGDGPELLAPEGFEWAAPALAMLGAKGAVDEVTRLVAPGESGRVVVVAGVGDTADAAALRLAAGAAVRALATAHLGRDRRAERRRGARLGAARGRGVRRVRLHRVQGGAHGPPTASPCTRRTTPRRSASTAPARS